MLPREAIELTGRLMFRWVRIALAVLSAAIALFIALGLVLAPPPKIAVVVVLAIASALLLWLAWALRLPHTAQISQPLIQARLAGAKGKRQRTTHPESSDPRPVDILFFERSSEPERPQARNARPPNISNPTETIEEDRTGTATENQRYAVEQLGLNIDVRELSIEQAHGILSARNYVRGVIHRLDLSTAANTKLLERELATFIINRPPLLDRAIAWSDRSFARGRAEFASPRRDEHWNAVVAEANRLLTSRAMR
jgi:hypothetical protein